MDTPDFEGLRAQIAPLNSVTTVGRVTGVEAGRVIASGLDASACIGDQAQILLQDGSVIWGEVVQLINETIVVLPQSDPEGVSLQDRVAVMKDNRIAPSDAWIGRVIDPFGQPLDGHPLVRGRNARDARSTPPPATARRPLGARLETGLSVFNTMLPIVRGQRVGLFAGSGVGKSSLLGQLARNMQADVVVFAMIGERGREVRAFIDEVLGKTGMARSVVVAATSDQSPLERRRCAWTAMCVAEHFRDQGKSVLLLADSITRFAEAHREVAVAAGEAPVLRGFPASTSHMIMSLCERAGPGLEGQGDITALFTVLVAGSDMDEPVADILRGVLDGHVVLDREIAERGRYPAIDLLRSVSRSLPAAATAEENDLIKQARIALGLYDRNKMMINAGLYTEGADPSLDQAVRLWPELDGFLAQANQNGIEDSFARLALILRRGKSTQRTAPATDHGQPPKPASAGTR